MLLWEGSVNVLNDLVHVVLLLHFRSIPPAQLKQITDLMESDITVR